MVVGSLEEVDFVIFCLNIFWYLVDMKNFFVFFFYYGDLNFQGEE